MPMVMCIKASEMKITGQAKQNWCFTDEQGQETRELIHDFKGAGILQDV